MKILCSLMVVLILRQAIAGIVRKPPAFSTPVYANSYLPAVMQVIFHTVEQLKQLQAEETSQESLISKLPTSTELIEHEQSQSTTLKETSMTSTATTAKIHDEKTKTPEMVASILVSETSNQGSSEIYDDLTEAAQHVETSISSSLSNHEETPEVNEEMAEINYESPATPEANHELPELVQETQESNQEVPEKSEEYSTIVNFSKDETLQYDNMSQQQSTQISVTRAMDSQKKKEPTVDSVVDEIYEIVKTSTSPFSEEPDITSESKSAMGISMDKIETIEDEEDETRFTLLGEKVSQVPRPSLNSYLKRVKVPVRPALQQLANLYDSLSKDARKQGFARFAGYSDEILKSLHSSAEGGVGPQLKQLLEKVVERNELTRDDAKIKTSQALNDLDNPASALNKDLRRLLPLRFTP
ncbi:uncharacterized protein LOC114936578 isoform X2 [Nylanderia fulva]|uniref:uncharacterized protein LOC114936578 isoform X2 n=1 Tax=Nylanderia fulva TaxID=613905 RepID=UPI0010FB2AF5|nr:uncharacterized protein LOC114936578 isoform X2 [Nylanderia fulva]